MKTAFDDIRNQPADGPAEAALSVERHGDLFPPEGSDEHWQAHCGSQRRLAITHNSRIRHGPNERAAVQRFAVQLIVVVGHAPTAELARNFVATVSRLESWQGRHPGPAILKRYRPSAAELSKTPDAPGRVALWHPKA